MYIITITRLDLGFALSMLLYYYFNSNSTYIYATICVLKYVKEILYYDIYYEENKNLINYIDVDFAKTIDNYCLTNR